MVWIAYTKSACKDIEMRLEFGDMQLQFYTMGTERYTNIS